MLPGYEDLKHKRRAMLVLLGACLAVFFTASEVRYPVVSLGFVGFTSSELAAGFFLLTSLVWAFTSDSRFLLRRTLDLPVALFVATNFLSVAAAADKPGAFKFSLRMTYAALLYLGISRLPARSRSHLAVAGAAGAALSLVTAIGLLEAHAPFIDWARLLSPWREGTATFGTVFNLRVSSILPYPTTLAMYLELVFPLALAAGLWLAVRQAGRTRILLLSGAAAGTVAVMAVLVNTYTRSAMVAGPLSLLAAAALAKRFGYPRLVTAFFALSAAILVAVLGVSVVTSNTMAVRLGLAEQENPYGAEYALVDLPQDLKPGGEYTARINIKNTSSVYWSQKSGEHFAASFYWLNYPEKEFQQDLPHPKTELRQDVAPGESINLEAGLLTPETPGMYVLGLELVKVGFGPFSMAGVPPLEIPLELDQSGARRFTMNEANERLPVLSSPGRNQLWPAALKAWRSHPLLGIGADQFRSHYGEYLPGVPQDDRVGANNIFLEALVNTGPLGLAAMLFLLGSAVWRSLQLVRDTSLGGGCRLVSLALFSALAAYVMHGLLDYFLWQTAIAFMFFAELGLISWMYQERAACQDFDSGNFC